MPGAGIYTWWQKLRKGKSSGQIATLVTLIIAVIFLFVMVTLNIGRLAHKKTVTANAADGAAMKMASYVGSYANLLSIKYVKGKDKYCKRNLGGIFAIIAIVVAIVLHQYHLIHWLVIAAAAASYAYAVTVAGDNVAKELKSALAGVGKLLNQLELKARITELGVLYALSNAVDDPNLVIDDHDYDEDMETDDKIPAFAYWYYERARALVDAQGASPDLRAIIAEFIVVMREFALAADEFRRNFTEDATRPLAWEECECPEGEEKECDCADWPAEVLEYAGADGEFVDLLRHLYTNEIEVSFWIPDADTDENIDQVDDLSASLYNFYQWTLGDPNGLLLQEFDAIVEGLDIWRATLYSEEEEEEEEGEEEETPKETWYETWVRHIDDIDGWLAELPDVISQLDALIAEETDPDQIDYLTSLKDRVGPAMNQLTEFRQTLVDFNEQILAFYQATIVEEASNPLEGKARYTWHDTSGWHHVYVEASKIESLPTIRVKKSSKWYGYKICVMVSPASGPVTVTVARYDQSLERPSFTSGVYPLWRFRFADDQALQDAPDQLPHSPPQFVPSYPGCDLSDSACDPLAPGTPLSFGMKSVSTTRWYAVGLPKVETVQ